MSMTQNTGYWVAITGRSFSFPGSKQLPVPYLINSDVIICNVIHFNVTDKIIRGKRREKLKCTVEDQGSFASLV